MTVPKSRRIDVRKELFCPTTNADQVCEIQREEYSFSSGLFLEFCDGFLGFFPHFARPKYLWRRAQVVPVNEQLRY